jgi:hypothetical protein
MIAPGPAGAADWAVAIAVANASAPLAAVAAIPFRVNRTMGVSP